MADEITLAQRRTVASRANYRCEYCRMPEAELLAGCEVDHVISRKHGGVAELGNLAFSCERCNRAKGTDVGSVVAGKFIRFFNPRIDRWQDHFRLNGAHIEALTDIGEATVKLLRLNAPDRILQRRALQHANVYPRT
jgi:hypothetical protein